ncbi:MAG: cobalamin biosynthesis protein CobW [Gammaproteobacteria bacterium]|nr:cobalamin biosynthesis protein CobW [Gammaproteobacteria bacterium]
MNNETSVQSLIADGVPTHIITGFLGAGKTTLLKHLLAQKPVGETWAVLVNEFGQIGLDGALLDADADIAIHEVVGGCLCCTSQLPMQVGLSRLLTKTKPTRLFIEPTGLGHPLQLVEQLSEPHWARALDLRAIVTVVDGTRLFETKLTTHETYQAQFALADILVISHQDQMTSQDHQQLAVMQDQLAQIKVIAPSLLFANQGELNLVEIDRPRQIGRQTRRSLLHVSKKVVNVPQDLRASEGGAETIELPYHYHEEALAQSVGGWRLPADWIFDRDRLLMWLLSLQGWMRIKGVIRVHSAQKESEWLALNLIPAQISFTSHTGNDDNRLEIITQPNVDWDEYEQAFMACRVDVVTA